MLEYVDSKIARPATCKNIIKNVASADLLKETFTARPPKSCNPVAIRWAL